MATQYELVDNPNELNVCYIAGGMTQVGPPTWNYSSFERMAKRLRKAGWQVISPHELHGPDEGTGHDWFMRRDVAELVKCGRIVMLRDWEQSKGARMEFDLAVGLGMDVWYEIGIDHMSDEDLESFA